MIPHSFHEAGAAAASLPADNPVSGMSPGAALLIGIVLGVVIILALFAIDKAVEAARRRRIDASTQGSLLRIAQVDIDRLGKRVEKCEKRLGDNIDFAALWGRVGRIESRLELGK
jgi:hypothetical protein